MPLLTALSRALSELMPGGARWLVAVSGGADSVAALRLMVEASRSAASGSVHQVFAAHLDHQLRTDSADDAAFVAELCASLAVTLRSDAVDVRQVANKRGWNLEDAARRLRYSFLHAAARELGADAIVVAHTRDDQAETFLRQALRGSSFPVGMPAKRGKVVRPLLTVSRRALREYLEAIGQVWREDETNLDVAGQERAWLRHRVLPLLQERYPHAPARLARTAAGLTDVRLAVEQMAARLFGTTRLSIAALAAAPVALQRAALVGLLSAAGVEPAFDLVEEARAAVGRAARAGGGGAAPWRISVADGKVLRVAYGRVEVVTPALPTLAKPVAIDSLEELRAALAAGGAPVPADLPSAEAVAELAAEHADLVLRHRRDSDRIRLAGGSKLVSDLLIDLEVPREERGGLRLLAAGGEVFWIEGVVAAEGIATGAPAGDHPHGDRHWMRLALAQARRAAALGEMPVGAAVVKDGRLLAAAHNGSEAGHDPSAHAELLALRQAAAAEGDWRLAGATLYVTLEPCPMCFGAVLQTQLARVVYAADNLREGALGSVIDLRLGRWKRVPEVDGGVMAKESGRLLRRFFAARRQPAAGDGV